MMKNKKYLITAILGAFLGFMTCYIFAQRSEDARSISTAPALAATTGQLVNLYFESARSTNIDTSRRLLKAIRGQAVILVTLNLDPAEMNAVGFEGFCRLVSSSSNLFSITNSDSVEGIMDPFLRAQLDMHLEGVAKESLKRSQRKADSHSCPGFN